MQFQDKSLKITSLADRKRIREEWLIRQQVTSGFTQAGVYARKQFCADLEVCRPPEPL